MKKLFGIIALLIVFVAAPVWAQDVVWHNANQVTVGWDAVTQDIDGDPITGVTYEVLLANADTDPSKTNPVVVAETDLLEATLTMTKGRYFVGVRAVYLDMMSGINWGDELENQEGYDLIALRFAVPPKTPPGLRR